MSPGKCKPPKKSKVKPVFPTGPSPNDPHEVAYFKRHPDDDPDETMPGREFIQSCPDSVRAKIRTTLVAVAKAPPNKFAGGDAGNPCTAT